MKIEEIKELMSHMKSMGLTNFEYEGQGIKVKMGVEQALNASTSTSNQGGVVSVVPPISAPSQISAADLVEDVMGETVKSPIVGVFYEASGPDKPAFAKVGDTVKKGDVLCIVEAMKVMNEIVADKACKITKVLCNNEDVVEYGQPLFEIEAL